ncbi:MAG: hypothetical protein FGF48_07755 [Candidatus Brockarchaeota archaeon]|nr:hypothetical protein [Candidatus Brockarchaeota archaeon]
MLREIEGIREWMRKPFSFQPLWPLALAAIILVVLIEASGYLYGLRLGDWKFSASILLFAIALCIGAFIERFGVKNRGLTLLSFSLLFASNVFFLLGLISLLLMKSQVELMIFLPFETASIALLLVYSLKKAYNILRMGRKA